MKDATQHTTKITDSLFSALAQNTTERTHGHCVVRGRLPKELNGVLYLNGPGIFQRGQHRKESLLDGDGILQRLELREGKAHYIRRFVRTEKFLSEEKAQRFLHPTWTTKAPNALANLGGRIKSQAGITATLFNDELYALDEASPGYRIDAQTLETLGPATLHLPERDKALKAHTRYLPQSKSWLLASTRMGRHGMTLDFVRRYSNGYYRRTPTVAAPRMVYLHDFGATERYAVVILQPAFFNPLRFLSGQSTFANALKWRPKEGNVILLVDLDTGHSTRFDAPAAWVWHIANTYQSGSSIIMDFIGYDDPEHFLGRDAQLSAIMHGKVGNPGSPGTLRRYILDTHTRQLTQEIIAAGNYEFPNVNPESSGRQHNTIFTTSDTAGNGLFHHQITAIQPETGQTKSFDFGPQTNVLEPVYAYSKHAPDDKAWIISQILDTQRNCSGFAILQAHHIDKGPIATIDLKETIPISFHGHWTAY